MSAYEQARLQALHQLNLLDTPPSESFDRITRLASQLFDLPIAAISLSDADRQWFKSRVGVDHWQIPRDKAPCGEVSDDSEVVVVPDLLTSDCYQDCTLSRSGIRFYAGAPLLTHDGYTLGAMCVLGYEPREITSQEEAMLRDLAAMVMAQIDLQHAFGRVDPLTGLPNRSQFVEDLQDLALDAPGASRFAFFSEVLDVTQLNAVHRVLGPTCLDELVRKAGQRLQAMLPHGTRLYHLGLGQHVHLGEASDDVALLEEALRLRSDLLALETDKDAAVLVRPVVGVAPFRLGEQAADDILRVAHSACHDARRADTGAGIYSLALDERYRRRFQLLSDLRDALADDAQLRLAFQPRVNVASGVCQGVEALLRWRHPSLGEVSPGEFIPLIEHTPLARPLTAWVLESAIRQAAVWRTRGLVLRVSVNVSAVNLEEADFTERLIAQLASHGLPHDGIELELTESALVAKGRAASQQLERLVAAGIRIAIDDFGTGYSSLAYLQEIPAQVVKIDRSFVAALTDEAQSQMLVRAMIALAHELGHRVVGEGVERAADVSRLAALGCDEVQGFYFARPLSPVDLEAWLASPRPA